MGLTLPVLDRSKPPPRPGDAARGLIDSHGRRIHELRLSVTDRCNFRCVYCMEPDTRFMPKMELLSLDEYVRVAAACVGLGVTKVRITGGEPTVYPRLLELIERLAALGAPDLAMTTNGALADEESLGEWRAAGLRRLTFSIDSVSPGVFSKMTRSNVPVERVLEAVEAAGRLGFERTKLNAVVVRGLNENEVPALAELARRFGVEMRFIEFMPLDSGHAWDRSKLVPASEIVERIAAVYPLRELGKDEPSSTAIEYGFADGAPGRIGIIAPVTRAFCGQCSRLRITADGKVRPCLFSRQEWDLRPLLRGGADDVAVSRFLVDATWTKQAGHGISSAGFVQPERTMSAIGG
jgi:cyclic pyranopterin phosphate synthase